MKKTLLLSAFFVLLTLNLNATVNVKLLDQNIEISEVAPYLDSLDLMGISINNPQIVVWFCGAEGLTQRSYEFYTNNFLLPMDNPLNARTYRCYLYDLQAWSWLKRGIFELSPTINMVAQQNNQRLSSLSSKDFFENLANPTINELAAFQQALGNQFVWQQSANRKPSKKTLGDVLPVPGVLSNINTVTGYSALQYLEGLWIIRQIVRNQDAITKTINIVFLLPSSGTPEYKYYCPADDNMTFFEQDIEQLLACDGINNNVNIYFIGFPYECEYNNKKCTRPYVFIRGFDQLITI